METRKKTVAIPTPRNMRTLKEGVLAILELEHVIGLEVTAKQIKVTGTVSDEAEDQDLLPPMITHLLTSGEHLPVDLATLVALPGFEMVQLPFDPAQHPLHVVIAAMHMLESRGLRAAAFFSRQGDWLDAFLGLDAGTLPLTLFGAPVQYTHDIALEEGKLLVVGSPTGLMLDAKCGIIVEIGAMS